MFAAKIPNSAIPRSTSMNRMRSDKLTGPTRAASGLTTCTASASMDHPPPPNARHHSRPLPPRQPSILPPLGGAGILPAIGFPENAALSAGSLGYFSLPSDFSSSWCLGGRSFSSDMEPQQQIGLQPRRTPRPPHVRTIPKPTSAFSSVDSLPPPSYVVPNQLVSPNFSSAISTLSGWVLGFLLHFLLRYLRTPLCPLWVKPLLFAGAPSSFFEGWSWVSFSTFFSVISALLCALCG